MMQSEPSISQKRKRRSRRGYVSSQDLGGQQGDAGTKKTELLPFGRKTPKKYWMQGGISNDQLLLGEPIENHGSNTARAAAAAVNHYDSNHNKPRSVVDGEVGGAGVIIMRRPPCDDSEVL